MRVITCLSFLSLSLSSLHGGGGFRVTGRTVVKTREEREEKSCENWAREKEGREGKRKRKRASFVRFVHSAGMCVWKRGECWATSKKE